MACQKYSVPGFCVVLNKEHYAEIVLEITPMYLKNVR